jgi:bacterioferritin-associated ferredoxin
MFVCIYNGLTDSQVKTAIDQGARSVAAVYKALGASPECGKCTKYVHEMLQEHLEKQKA